VEGRAALFLGELEALDHERNRASRPGSAWRWSVRTGRSPPSSRRGPSRGRAGRRRAPSNPTVRSRAILSLIGAGTAPRYGAAITSKTSSRGASITTDAVRAVSVLSTGTVEIHPEHAYGTRKPLYWWLLVPRAGPSSRRRKSSTSTPEPRTAAASGVPHAAPSSRRRNSSTSTHGPPTPCEPQGVPDCGDLGRPSSHVQRAGAPWVHRRKTAGRGTANLRIDLVDAGRFRERSKASVRGPSSPSVRFRRRGSGSGAGASLPPPPTTTGAGPRR
jgi:hypothetical protein